MQNGRHPKIGTAPKVNIWKVFLRPILSEIPAHPTRPAKFPTAIAIKYEEANEAVTIWGIELANTSAIIGLATDINPIPPVASNVDVENNSQN